MRDGRCRNHGPAAASHEGRGSAEQQRLRRESGEGEAIGELQLPCGHGSRVRCCGEIPLQQRGDISLRLAALREIDAYARQ